MSGGAFGDFEVPVQFDLQEAYDSSRAMARAFDAFADELAAHADVCRHPESSTREVPAGPEIVEICGACDAVVKSRPNPDAGT